MLHTSYALKHQVQIKSIVYTLWVFELNYFDYPHTKKHLDMEDISNFSWDSFSQQWFEEVVVRHVPTLDVPYRLFDPNPDSVDDIIKKIQHFYPFCNRCKFEA